MGVEMRTPGEMMSDARFLKAATRRSHEYSG